MKYKENKEWQRIFGSVWSTLIKNAPGVGGFLLDHENRCAYADENAEMIMDIGRNPAYDDVTGVVARLMDSSEKNNTICVNICEYNEKFTAGFFMIKEKNITEGMPMLPLRPLSELIIAMTEGTGKGHSMLALIQFDPMGNIPLCDFHVYTALSALKNDLPAGALLSSNTKNRFWLYIPNFSSNEAEFLKNLRTIVENCILTDEAGDVEEGQKITFSAGIAADLPVPSGRMHTAEFTLYEAVQSGAGSICKYSEERYEHRKQEYDSLRRFSRLIENNLFVYHYQPIISARTGEIYAYEALMRTDESIGMYPMEILSAAARYGRLYDIEKATLFNNMEFISRNQDFLKDRRLFVNSITSHMLDDADWSLMESKYGELMEKMVVELTEQTEISDESLAIVHERLGRSNMHLAIDDYGTGYSNMSNLLRYSPNVVKIDRSLITNIDTNPKMQKFVTSIIEFVHSNGFSALAEGVETYEELKTMINMGSDLIQGFFVSKPKPVLINEVSQNVRQNIIDINAEYHDNIKRFYHTENGETIHLEKLIAEHCNVIFVRSSSVIIEGTPNSKASISIIVKDRLETNIIFRDVSLSVGRAEPVISLGSDSKAKITVEGDCEIIGKGIYVPASASVEIAGTGNLLVHSEAHSGFGIGADKNQSHGEIICSCSGRLTVEANGENMVGIGGGKNLSGNSICIRGGNITVNCSGGTAIAIGTFEGDMIADISECSLAVHISAENSIALGTVSGSTDIMMKNYAFSCELSGLNLVGAGSVSEGAGKLSFISGEFKGVMHGRNIVCMGTRNGTIDTVINHSSVDFYCEGSTVSGVGDMVKGGDIGISESTVKLDFRTGEGMGIDTKCGRIFCENADNNIIINA